MAGPGIASDRPALVINRAWPQCWHQLYLAVYRYRPGWERCVNNFDLLIGWQRNLDFFTTGYNFFVRALSYLVVAPVYLPGRPILAPLRRQPLPSVRFSRRCPLW